MRSPSWTGPGAGSASESFASTLWSPRFGKQPTPPTPEPSAGFFLIRTWAPWGCSTRKRFMVRGSDPQKAEKCTGLLNGFRCDTALNSQYAERSVGAILGTQPAANSCGWNSSTQSECKCKAVLVERQRSQESKRGVRFPQRPNVRLRQDEITWTSR